MQYGFKEPKIEEDNYFLGGYRSLPKIVLRKDGQWIDYLPEFEPQRKLFETFNCTGFGTNKALQILLNIMDIEENESDRFLGINAGTDGRGNDPHTVAEALRSDGCIPEEILPFSDNLYTISEYYSFKGADKKECKDIGQEWVDKYKFGHEYVFRGNKDNKQEKMMEALRYSPLGVSVNAWRKSGDLYIKNKGERDNHWTLCIGYKKNKYWLIADTYIDDGTPIKKLAWDYDFRFCKRFHVEKRTTEKQPVVEDWLTRLIRMLREAGYNIGSASRQTLRDRIEAIKRKIVQLQERLKKPTGTSEDIYRMAKSLLGKKVRTVSKELACANCINIIVKKAIGKEIGGGSSTWRMYNEIRKEKLFIEVKEPRKGDIILSPTGFQTNFKDGKPIISNGHVGILGEYKIYSNDSNTGLLSDKWTIKKWKQYYGILGGFPIEYYRLK